MVHASTIFFFRTFYFLDLAKSFLGGGGGGGGKGSGHKTHTSGREYENELINGEVYEHKNEYEPEPETNSSPETTELNSSDRKPSAEEAIQALDTYTKWFHSEMGVDTKDKTNFETYRNKAIEKLKLV